MKTFNPGTKIIVKRPDAQDLLQGICSGMQGIVLEVPYSWRLRYPHVLKVRIPALSDEGIYYLELNQVEELC